MNNINKDLLMRFQKMNNFLIKIWWIYLKTKKFIKYFLNYYNIKDTKNIIIKNNNKNYWENKNNNNKKKNWMILMILMILKIKLIN